MARSVPNFVFIVLLVSAVAGCTTTNSLQSRNAILVTSDDLRQSKSVRSWKYFKEKNVVMQRTDYSCGASALATLVTYHFGGNITEGEVLKEMQLALTPAEVVDRKDKGFNFTDLKRWAEVRGYETKAWKLPSISLLRDFLRAFPRPVIVHLERDGYKHFAVLRGLQGDRVFLADPSRGNVRQSIFKFELDWTGNVFALRSKESRSKPSDFDELVIRVQNDDDIEMVSASRALQALR